MAQDDDAMRRAALTMIELRMMMMMMRMRMLMRLRIRRLQVGDNGNQIENRRKQLDKTPACLREGGRGKKRLLLSLAQFNPIQSHPITQPRTHTHTHHTVSGKSMAISAIIKSANAQHHPPFAACRIRVQRRRSAAQKKKRKKKLSTYLVCSSIGKLSS